MTYAIRKPRYLQIGIDWTGLLTIKAARTLAVILGAPNVTCTTIQARIIISTRQRTVDIFWTNTFTTNAIHWVQATFGIASLNAFAASTFESILADALSIVTKSSVETIAAFSHSYS